MFYFKSINGESIKVNFKSFYRQKLEEKHQLYNEIINTIWDLHLYDLADFYLNKILNGEVVKISNVSINNSGILIEKETVDFKDIQLKQYYHHVAVSSALKPDICRLMNFSKDENAVLAADLLNYLIKKSNEEKSAP